jgi:curved DNA-binding protein
MNKDYYKTLGISKTASQEEIKKAYRKLAMKHHPDRTQGDNSSDTKFKEIAEAYSVLSDEKKKMIYDNGGNQNDFEHHFNQNHFEPDDLKDIFSHFFDMNNSKANYGFMEPELDLNYKISISLEQAVLGAELKIQVSRTENIDLKPINKTVPVTVKIPAGIEDGMIIKLANEGNSTKKQKGNLNLTVNIQSKDNYVRKGSDLYLTKKIDFVTVLLGGDVEINSITGDFQITIPPNSKNGMKLRVRGKGVKNVKSNHVGDLYIVIDMTTPTTLTEKQKKLLKQFNS